MNSILNPATLLKVNFFLGVFQGFCLEVSEAFFYRTPLYVFVVTESRLCTVLKDTHWEKAPSNETPALTKSMIMGFLNWNKVFKK